MLVLMTRGICSHATFCFALVWFSPWWHPSLSQLTSQPPTSINSNQCQSIHPVPAFTRLSSSSVTCFLGTTARRCRSVGGRGSGTQLTGVPGPGTGTGPPRPGEQPEGGCACSLLSCFVQPYSPSEVLYGRHDVLLVSGTLGQLRHRPIRPFPAVGSSRNRSQRGLWSLLSSRRFMGFS